MGKNETPAGVGSHDQLVTLPEPGEVIRSELPDDLAVRRVQLWGAALIEAERERRESAPELLEFVQEWLERQGNDCNYMTEKARAIVAKALRLTPPMNRAAARRRIRFKSWAAAL